MTTASAGAIGAAIAVGGVAACVGAVVIFRRRRQARHGEKRGWNDEAANDSGNPGHLEDSLSSGKQAKLQDDRDESCVPSSWVPTPDVSHATSVDVVGSWQGRNLGETRSSSIATPSRAWPLGADAARHPLQVRDSGLSMTARLFVDSSSALPPSTQPVRASHSMVAPGRTLGDSPEDVLWASNYVPPSAGSRGRSLRPPLQMETPFVLPESSGVGGTTLAMASPCVPVGACAREWSVDSITTLGDPPNDMYMPPQAHALGPVPGFSRDLQPEETCIPPRPPPLP